MSALREKPAAACSTRGVSDGHFFGRTLSLRHCQLVFLFFGAKDVEHSCLESSLLYFRGRFFGGRTPRPAGYAAWTSTFTLQETVTPIQPMTLPGYERDEAVDPSRVQRKNTGTANFPDFFHLCGEKAVSKTPCTECIMFLPSTLVLSKYAVCSFTWKCCLHTDTCSFNFSD